MEAHGKATGGSFMTRAKIVGGALATLLVLLALAAGRQNREHDVGPAEATPPAANPTSSTAAALEAHLYGRVTIDDGTVYEGRLRWGGDEEALWGNYFDGVKDENPWAAKVQRELLMEPQPIEILGVEIAGTEREIDLGRPFMARFGDIARIDAHGRGLSVTLKSGTVFDLDRFSADDLADGVRVWDGRRGVVDFDEWRIRTIELLSTARQDAAPDLLHGTVRTRDGDFTGFVQWEREQCLGSDVLDGHTADGKLSLPFDTIQHIARRSPDSALVTLLDGREIVLSDTRDGGQGDRGIYVDDQRYGRVLISWDAFERIDFSPGGPGPGYDDFPPGQPLTGSVITRSGRQLAGRLVYDLDERESTETFDAPSEGVDYTIPFGLIASIVLPGVEARDAPRARVTLYGGEELQLERSGDLGEGNAGMLIFQGGQERPEYVPWTDVAEVDFDRPPEMYPPDVRSRSRAEQPRHQP